MATVTINGVELDAVSEAMWAVTRSRWTCLVCNGGFGMKARPAYRAGSSGCCAKCAAALPGAQPVAAPAAHARPHNLSRVNSQSGGSHTDIAEDCGPERSFHGDVYGGDL